MRTPTISDEELKAAAEALHAEGQLSIRRLRARVGGGDTGRLSTAAREVREAASPAPDPLLNGEGENDPSAEPELPKSIASDLDRLRIAVLRELEQVRQREVDRARAAEAALTTNHAEEVQRLMSETTLLREDMSDLELAVEEHLGEIARLNAAEAEARGALARSEEERRTAFETHATERRTLSDTIARLEAERAEEVEGRRRAEATLEETRSRNSDLGAELQQNREELMSLRSSLESETARREELESKCASAVQAAEQSAARLAEVEAMHQAAAVECAELKGRAEAQDGLIERLEKALRSEKKPSARTRRKKS